MSSTPPSAGTDLPYPEVPTRADFPAIERRILARWADQSTFERSVAAAPGGRRVRLLRRPAVRQRPAPLRPPAHRLRQGRRAALPDHARPPRRAPLRLGLPRPARRDADREGARRLGPGRDHRLRHRPLQRRLPHLGAALHRRVGALRHPPGPLGRLRRRLQDDGRHLHGVGHLGVQAAVGQGPHLRGVPGHAVLVGRRDAAVELRDPPRRRHPPRQDPALTVAFTVEATVGRGRRPARGARRARRHRDLGVDDHAVDAAVEPGARRRPDVDYVVVQVRRGPPGRASRRARRERGREVPQRAGRGPPGRGHPARAARSPGCATGRCSPTSPTTPTASGCSSTTSSPTTTAPASCTWPRASARTTSASARPPASCWSARRRLGPLHRRGRPTTSARTSSTPTRDHRRPQGRGHRGPPRHLRPQLPALLAHRHADHLQGRVVAGTSRSPRSATAWSS